MIEGQNTTDFLEGVLRSSGADKIDAYLDDYADKLMPQTRSFTMYMRDKMHAHARSQRDIFIAGNISEKYGYGLISGEKHTVQRDLIVKLCLASHFTLDETQTALKLYGMSPLYAKVARDAVLLIAVNTGIFEIADVDELLEKHGFCPLYCGDESV